MQVLVIFARAKGEVVSRDDLIETCWGGRIVGDDAITRVLSQLRHIGEEFAGGAFRIETIRGVGSRLVVPAASARGGRVVTGLGRRQLLFALAATASAAASVGVLLRHKPAAVSAQAKEYYRRGIETRGQDSLERMEQGAALFREATRIDPQFADAWGALALSYRGFIEYDPGADTARLTSLSRGAASRALALDPDNVEARAALFLLKPYRGNWLAFDGRLRALLKEQPRNGLIEFHLGLILCEVGRWKDAIPILRHDAALEPFWPLVPMILVEAYYSTGMNEEGDDLVESAMKKFPRRTHFWVVHMRHLIGAGRLGEALAFAGNPTMRPDDITDPRIEFETWIADALSKGTSAARAQALARISAILHDKPAMLEAGAHSACVLGDVDAAFAMLEGFYFGRGPWGREQWQRARTRVLFWPGTAALRADPRFPDLVRRLGLEHYWQSTGTLPDYRRLLP